MGCGDDRAAVAERLASLTRAWSGVPRHLLFIHTDPHYTHQAYEEYEKVIKHTHTHIYTSMSYRYMHRHINFTQINTFTIYLIRILSSVNNTNTKY